MLDKELELTLNKSFKEARERRHEFMTVEHLLLALLENPTASHVLKACGANLNALHNDLLKFIQENSPLLNNSIADLAFRTKTCATIIAIERDKVMHNSPDPKFSFQARDKVFITGKREDINKAIVYLTKEKQDV